MAFKSWKSAQWLPTYMGKICLPMCPFEAPGPWGKIDDQDSAHLEPNGFNSCGFLIMI